MNPRTRTFPGLPESVGEARAFVAGVLTDAGLGDVDVARLLTSEAVTNSVQHSMSGWEGGKIRVSVTAVAGKFARIDVRDEGPAAGKALVVPVSEPPPGESGMGLWVMSQAAGSFGFDGKGLVWFRLPWTAGAAAEEPGALFELPVGGAW
jgi:anti-sigma regulatory factor (Ser/Thr protein kinase)